MLNSKQHTWLYDRYEDHFEVYCCPECNYDLWIGVGESILGITSEDWFPTCAEVKVAQVHNE